MAIKEGLRPGGRSARVQESVHCAVRPPLEEQDRTTVPAPPTATPPTATTPTTIPSITSGITETTAATANNQDSYHAPTTITAL